MIDISTRRVVDMLESRDTEAVAAWLATYPNIKVVSRDGSQQYASAIRSAHPNAAQVSDRFHLVKNLTDAAKQHIMRIIPTNICIPAREGESGIGGGYWEKDECHSDDLPARLHSASTERKRAKVEMARTLAAQGLSFDDIARKIGICGSTAKKYINDGFNPGNKHYGSNMQSVLDPYRSKIDSMLRERCKFKDIEAAIREVGYSGAASTIRMYATRQRRIMKAASNGEAGRIELVERKWVVKLLYKPIEKIKDISQEQVDRIVAEHPVVGSLYDIVRSFKEMMFAKHVDDLDLWIDAALGLGIDEINSFVNGIKADLEAVKNSIKYDYNNGLAEGFVNKLKVVKRIMYGRSSFMVLRKKLVRDIA
jgi:transposase